MKRKLESVFSEAVPTLVCKGVIKHAMQSFINSCNTVTDYSYMSEYLSETLC